MIVEGDALPPAQVIEPFQGLPPERRIVRAMAVHHSQGGNQDAALQQGVLFDLHLIGQLQPILRAGNGHLRRRIRQGIEGLHRQPGQFDEQVTAVPGDAPGADMPVEQAAVRADDEVEHPLLEQGVSEVVAEHAAGVRVFEDAAVDGRQVAFAESADVQAVLAGLL